MPPEPANIGIYPGTGKADILTRRLSRRHAFCMLGSAVNVNKLTPFRSIRRMNSLKSGRLTFILWDRWRLLLDNDYSPIARVRIRPTALVRPQRCDRERRGPDREGVTG
jgi:hypothetical protein